MTIRELKEAVKKLSPQERILLVRYVLGTLVDEGTDLSNEWKKELDARSEVFKKGEAKTYSWAEVKEQLNR